MGSPRMKYRAEIDGMRAIAVIPVILFHAGISGFGGGFVGVDIFFVISGYLITNIIYQEIVDGKFSILNFYERRARRILPALFFVLTVCIVPAYMWMMPKDFINFAESVGSAVLFIANIHFLAESGYFSPLVEYKPLLHTWSLAVEEQFYIFYPLVLIISFKYFKSSVFRIVLLISLASLILSEVLWRILPAANFFLYPSRAWELGAGALLALTAPSFLTANAKIREIAALIGFVVILGTIVFFDQQLPYPSLWTLAPVLGTVLVIAFADRENITGKLLSWPPLVGIGLISYSTYLWHQPLFAFARIRLIDGIGIGHFLALIFLSFLLGYLSWRFVESPFRVSGRYTRRQIFASGGIFGFALISFGLTVILSKGFPSRFDSSVLDIVQYDSGRAQHCASYKSGAGCWTGDLSTPPSIVVVGDSHANVLGYGLETVLKEKKQSAIIFGDAYCPPLYHYGTNNRGRHPECRARTGRSIDFATEAPEIRTVVLMAEWANYTKGFRWGDSIIAAYDDGTEKNEDVERNPYFFDIALNNTIDLLSKEKEVIIVGPVPEFHGDVPNLIGLAKTLGREIGDVKSLQLTKSDYLSRNEEVLASFGKVLSRVKYVDTKTIFFVEPHFLVQDDDGMPMYSDTNHLSYTGSLRLSRELIKLMAADTNTGHLPNAQN